MTDEVDICNRSLQMAAARASIASLTDGSNEAFNCNLLYTSIRNQVLGMAFWNFARRTINMNLIKAAPGTPESPTFTALSWIPAYPAPPWCYEYQYPTDCMQFRYLLTQPTSVVAINNVPIFSTPNYTFDPLMSGAPVPWDMATDVVGPVVTITNITRTATAVVTSAAHGFANGNIVYITGVIGMTQINNQLFTIGNVATDTFELVGTNTSQYQAYVFGGVAVNQSLTQTRKNVILSNAMGAIGTYTMLIDDLDLWPDQAQQALISALAGFLPIPLSGDKQLANMLVAQANNHILQARATDGNEGFTIQQYTPDWIRIRDGVYNGMDGTSGINVAPYPPLFAVA